MTQEPVSGGRQLQRPAVGYERRPGSTGGCLLRVGQVHPLSQGTALRDTKEEGRKTGQRYVRDALSGHEEREVHVPRSYFTSR